MTPVILEVLLFYYCSPDDYVGRGSPAETNAITYLLSEALIVTRKNHSGYQIGERGRAYVEALLKMPLPISVTRWEIPKHD